MFEQMVKDMYVPPDVLAQLSDEQRDVLHYEIRQEQIRRYNEWQNAMDNAPVTPKPRRKVKFPHQKKKKEKHVSFGVDSDGRLAVQKHYVEKSPPSNGTLSIIRPDGSTNRPPYSYGMGYPQMDGYFRHSSYAEDNSPESIILVPVHPPKQHVELQQSAFHGDVQMRDYHREERHGAPFGARQYTEPVFEPLRLAPIDDGPRAPATKHPSWRTSESATNNQTSSISIQLNRDRQPIRPYEYPLGSEPKTRNLEQGSGMFSSRRAMSMDFPSFDEPVQRREPENTKERIVHISRSSLSDLTVDTEPSNKIALSQKKAEPTLERVASPSSTDSTDSDVISFNRPQRLRRLMIAENGTVREVGQNPSLPIESTMRPNFEPTVRPTFAHSQHTEWQTSPSISYKPSSHPKVEHTPHQHFENPPHSNLAPAPRVDVELRSSPSSPRSNTETSAGSIVSSGEPRHFRQPFTNSPNSDDTISFPTALHAGVKSNGLTTMPSPAVLRGQREFSKTETKVNTLSPKIAPKNVSADIRRRQEELWKAVNQKEEKKISVFWFLESEAQRLIREFKLPQSKPPAGLSEYDFRNVPMWFHGPMSKMLAEQLLREDGRNGAFLVRVSSTFPGYVISYLSDDQCRHEFVSVISPEETSFSDSQLTIMGQTSYQLYSQMNSNRFETLKDLVHFYSTTSLSSRETQLLRHPVGQSRRKGELPDYAHIFYTGRNTSEE